MALQLPEQMTPQVKSKMLEMPLIGDMCETPHSEEDYNKEAIQSQDIAVSLQIGPVSVKMREHQTQERAFLILIPNQSDGIFKSLAV